tara:strand:- start:12278 stop:12757 length:480 start_codon:yes stop_codon:yes gene_type:complete
MTDPNRTQAFENFDQVIEQVQQRLNDGYTQMGKWNLAQCCEHLSEWMRYAMEGYPKSPLPIRVMVGLLKATMGRRLLANALKDGFKDGLPTIPQSVAAPDKSTDADAVRRLADMIERLKSYRGPIQPSPLYGPLEHDELMQLHLVHCAHHLKFLKPKSA